MVEGGRPTRWVEVSRWVGTQPACTCLLLAAQIQDRNRLFSLGVEHSLSKRKVDGSNPSIGLHFCSPPPRCVLLFFLWGAPVRSRDRLVGTGIAE